MIRQIAMLTESTAEIRKQRCPTDNSPFFYYTEAGLSLRCRHCKGVHVVSWEEILRKHAELCEEKR